MWLINTTTLQLKEFYPSKAPPYAILSHTWGDDEVTFRDMASPSATTKKGYAKIIQTCRLASGQNLAYAWIDTCCIDKSSSAELTESINSMFKWYEKAEVCYAFLEDLPPGGMDRDAFGSCRWFTRGWTLQELLAPRRLHFYDMEWTVVGFKDDLVDSITAITRIPVDVITGKRPISDYCVGSRMSWSAGRQTTREEDRAYSLLGIFGIAMPLIYGEGPGAFRRLQEEIIRRFNDLTIFGWELPPSQTPRLPADYRQARTSSQEQNVLRSPPVFVGPLATSPDNFTFVFDDYDHDGENLSSEFSITNRGIALSGSTTLEQYSWPDDKQKAGVYVLILGLGTEVFSSVVVVFHKIGPSIFCRDARYPKAFHVPWSLDTHYGRLEYKGHESSATKYLLWDGCAAERLYYAYRKHGLRLSPTTCNPDEKNWDDKTFELENVAPTSRWDAADCVILTPSPNKWDYIPDTALCMSFKVRSSTEHLKGTYNKIAVVASYHEFTGKPELLQFLVFDSEEENLLFSKENRVESLSLSQLKQQAPLLCADPRNYRVELKSVGSDVATTVYACIKETAFEDAITGEENVMFSLVLTVGHITGSQHQTTPE